MIYLDSLDDTYSRYSIDKNELEPQQQKPNKNDEKIGIISIIGIVAYAIYLILRWVI